MLLALHNGQTGSRPVLHTHSTTTLLQLHHRAQGQLMGKKGLLARGKKSLDRERGEVQSMSALGKTPFHLRDLLREDLIFIVFVLKALESKI